MASKYTDTSSIMQVIGCIYNNPLILDMTDKYDIIDLDFPDEFHRIVYGSIYKIHEMGASKISLENINDFLATRPKSQGIFQQQKGEEWLLRVSDAAIPNAFDYYYNRLKKMSLLRAYDSCGVDVTWLYDPDNILEPKKRQIQEEFLDNSSFEDIINRVERRIEDTVSQYISSDLGECYQAGHGIVSLIDRLKAHPEIGIPMYGPLVNSVTRGARLKKFYLRSAPTGVGKSRTMIADCCYIGCNKIYDETFGWIKNGKAEPCLYITTEQELEEIQTMMLAFLACVNEDHILNGMYEGDEEERVREAARILENSPIQIEVIPDFSLKDIEDKIKQHIREDDIHYVFYDYIHTSLKILEEITKRSGGIKLREDNVLFMLAIKLKDLCNQYGIFILSSTQLNGEWKEAEIPDQNLLRGAKSIADKIDLGEILLPVNEKDLEALEPILSNNAFEKPALKLSVYKNRRGKYKGVYLWCKADLGTCRVQPMFCTTFGYEIISIEDLKIVLEEEGAFEE